MKAFLLPLLLAVQQVPAVMAQAKNDNLRVKTANGIVEGVAEQSGIHSFK